ncbi:MAG: DUF748 domain-containing protein [Phycisphaerales bacterium]|nr:DUF748 domain-containing protein [Phycisphaerales bacterium]
MSQDSSSSNTPAPQKSEVKSPGKPRRWRKRLLYTLVSLVTLAIVLRIALIFLLPVALRKVADRYGLDLTYDRYGLSLLGGNMQLWRLNLTPHGQADQRLVYVEYIDGDISTWRLLRGQLLVYRAEADGVDLLIERNSDGTIPLLDAFLAPPPATAESSPPVATSNSSAPPVTPTAQAPQEAIDLTSPLRIDAFRLQHVNATFRDHTVSPAADTTLRMSIRLSDLGAPDRKTRFELMLNSDPLLDYLLVSGVGEAHGRNLDAQMELLMRGLRPRQIRSILEPLGLKPIADDLSARMTLSLHVEPAAGSATAVQAKLALNNLRATADDQESFAVDQIDLQATSLDYRTAHLAPVTLTGLRAHASRSSQGALRFFGIELIPAAPSAPASTPASSAAATAAGAPVTLSAPFTWSIEAIQCKDLSASFADHSFEPLARQALTINSIEVSRIDSADPGTPITLALNGQADAIARQITVTGSLSPFAPDPQAQFNLVIDGIHPVALQPYLLASGMTSQLNDARLTAELTGKLSTHANGAPSIDARLSNVNLSDGQELFSFAGIDLQGLVLDADQIGIDSIQIHGPSLGLTRQADGTLSALGLTFGSTAVHAAPTPASPSALPAADPSAVAAPMQAQSFLPRLHIGALDWKELDVHLSDQMIEPHHQLRLNDFGVELRDVTLDPNLASPSAHPGTLRLWASTEGLNRFEINGTLASQADALVAQLDLLADGISGQAWAPYLRPVGFEPVLHDGALRLHADASIGSQNGNTQIQASITKLALIDGQSELLGLDALTVDDIELSAGKTSVGKIRATRPRTQITRLADGTLQAVGLHLLPSDDSSTSTAATAASSSVSNKTVADNQAPSVSADSEPKIARNPSSIFELGQLDVDAAEISFDDQVAGAQLPVTINLGLQKLSTSNDAPAGQLQVLVSLPQTIDRLQINGTLRAALVEQALSLDLTASGIRQGLLKPYLPPHMSIGLDNGQLQAHAEVSSKPNPHGGTSLYAMLSNLRYTDNDQPLLQIARAGTSVSRLDPAGGLIAIDEIVLAGVQADVQRQADGSTQLLGVVLLPASAQHPAEPSAATADNQSAATAAATITTPPAPTTNLPPTTEVLRQFIPEINIQHIDVGVERLSIHNAAHPDAPTLTLTDFVIANEGAVRLLGADPASLPPVHLVVTGQLDPLIQQIHLDTVAAPFANEPTLTMDLNLTGINGQGVIAIAPQLAGRIDPSGLTEGSFTTHLEATARWQRRGPADFNFANGIDISLLMNNIAWRAQPQGPVLLGLNEIHADSIRIQPASSNVVIKELEINKPILNLLRSHDGLHLLGLVYNPAASTAQDSPQVSDQPSTAPTGDDQSALAAASTDAQPAPTAPAGQISASASSGHISINRLLLQDADIRIEDNTVNPAFMLPINSMDVELQGLILGAAPSTDPLRFSLIVGSDKVPLPTRQKGVTVDRELFSQITASGQLTTGPGGSGWIKNSISGFELTGLQGYADQAGVTLSAGTLDTSLDLRLIDADNMKASTKLIITDLSVTEPANGPISRVLILPAPLDIVLAALSGADGSITLPLSVPIHRGQVSGGAIAQAAIGAVGSVIATAIASAPMKVIGGVGALAGLDNSAPVIEPLELNFAPGDASLSRENDAALAQLAELLKRDSSLTVTIRHELGQDDIPRVQERANPSIEQCLELASFLEQRKAKLSESRNIAADQVQIALASGMITDKQAGVPELRRLDQSIARLENGLDQLYDMLRPGSDRQAPRRTRAAALNLGQTRLDAVRMQLSTSGIPDSLSRITMARPQFTTTDGATTGTVKLTVVKQR